MSFEGLIPNPLGPIEALKELWGNRGLSSRTHGSPNRTQAMTLLESLGAEADIPEFHAVAERMATLWASEGGWETEKLIAAVQASSGSQGFHPDSGKDGGRPR